MTTRNRARMSEAEVLELFNSCSNWARWGPSDEKGTLNYITADKRVQAARLVKSGYSVSLGRDLSRRWSRVNSVPIVHRMLYMHHDESISTHDSVDIAPHGFRITHIDAIGHVYFAGGVYNGRRAKDVVTSDGMSFASVHALSDGIFTRGVFLDVAAARGVDYLEPDAAILPDDLEAAERLAGLTVGPGDAIFVRCGLGAREAARGEEEDPSRRCGIAAESLPWIHERQVAVYSGDCVDQIPSGYPKVLLPLHMVGMVAMGLIMLDNTDMERLAQAVHSAGRSEFLVICSPLRIPGGTGSAVNPIAVF